MSFYMPYIGKKEANLLQLAYGGQLCHRADPLWCLIFTLSCLLLDALHHFVLDTVFKRMHRDLHKVPAGNISDFRVMPLILWSSKAGETISESCDVQDRNFCTEQRKEAVEVQEDFLGWEEQVNYIEWIFSQYFSENPKTKIKNSHL